MIYLAAMFLDIVLLIGKATEWFLLLMNNLNSSHPFEKIMSYIGYI